MNSRIPIESSNPDSLPEVFYYESAAMRAVYQRCRRIAMIDGPVLILGETGTGKSHLARIMHSLSKRRNNSVLQYGCGELSQAMLESALFGHTKDAYTSANSFQKGLLFEANHGTLILNDIDLLSPTMQSKLLRFLDDGTFSRLGEPGKPIVVDVRIVATTNKNLEARIKEGYFLTDLYYRLRTWWLTIPPLRQRPEEIKLLAQKFIEEFRQKNDFDGPPWAFASSALELFCSMNWNGNVRDLRAAVENIAVFGNGPKTSIELEEAAAVLFDPEHPFDARVNNDSSQLLRILEATKWNIALTSRITGYSRNTIYKRIKENNWRQP